MSLLAFISSALGGTLLSGVQQLAQEWFAVRRMKAESEIKMAEMNAMASIKMDELQWKAFEKSQSLTGTSSWVPTDKTPVWLTCAFGIAEILIKLVRPAMVLASYYFIALTFQDSGPADKPELAAAIQTFCFSVGYFWIGQRYQGKVGTMLKK
jgi:hypothetical protein